MHFSAYCVINKTKKQCFLSVLFAFLFLILFSTFVYSEVSALKEPDDVLIFRKAYPDFKFISSYDREIKDWKILVKIGNKSSYFYWADGRMLPKDNLTDKDKYNPLLYIYTDEIPDPTKFTKEDIENINKITSDDYRKYGVTTPLFFYDFIYDSKTRGSTEKHIIGRKFLKKTVNYHEYLKPILLKVEKRILALAETDAEVKKFVNTIGSIGCYHWRTIRDNSNRSFHSFGLAVDILPVKYEQKIIYWSWQKVLDKKKWMLTPLSKRWMPPKGVIQIFEEEGFIWGGKWVEWDNMHFEYHPELILYSKAHSKEVVE